MKLKLHQTIDRQQNISSFPRPWRSIGHSPAVYWLGVSGGSLGVSWTVFLIWMGLWCCSCVGWGGRLVDFGGLSTSRLGFWLCLGTRAAAGESPRLSQEDQLRVNRDPPSEKSRRERSIPLLLLYSPSLSASFLPKFTFFLFLFCPLWL